MDDPALDQIISDFLKETIDLIPVIYANDPRTQMLLQSQTKNMHSYTKKMWQGLGARSIVDYVTLTINLGHAFLAAKPKVVLQCETYAAYLAAVVSWIENDLCISLTPADHEGKNALMVLGQDLAGSVNKKLAALQASRK